MEAMIRIGPAEAGLEHAVERAGGGAVRVERAELEFACDPPLDGGFFPGPALRGLLGRLLERHGDAGCMDFLRNRFKGEKTSWRIGFREAPRPEGFRMLLSTFGPGAELDLAAAVSAFSMPGAELRLPGGRFRISLSNATDMMGAMLSLGGPDAECPETTSDGEDLEIHFITPLWINRDGHVWRAAQWKDDATPLLDSIRLRLADLAGIRRKIMPAPPPARFREVNVQDVRLDLPMKGRHKNLTGVLGSAKLESLPGYSRSLLHAAEILGLGHAVSYGLGTVLVAHAEMSSAEEMHW
jgi:hypothetical protein